MRLEAGCSALLRAPVPLGVGLLPCPRSGLCERLPSGSTMPATQRGLTNHWDAAQVCVDLAKQERAFTATKMQIGSEAMGIMGSVL